MAPTTPFTAFRIENDDAGYRSGLAQLGVDDLNPGQVLIRAHWSSVNYKDALAGTDTDGDLSEQRFLKSLKIRVSSDKKAVPPEAEDGKSFTITPQDVKFLKALKINIDDLSD